jgi:hypothetical protein
MKKTGIIAAALTLALQTTGAMAASVGGHYTIDGTNFDGSHYGGTVDITVSSNTTCRITWHIGKDNWYGICMRVDDALVAGYRLGNATGLVHYYIKPDGVLDGVWTLADHDGAGKEMLTPE